MLSVFIPAYNEESVLKDSVTAVIDCLRGCDFELYIVDDASDDGTRRIGEALARRDGRVKYLRYDRGPTRRENLADSFRNARGDLVVYIDADLSADPKHILELVERLGDADIAIGSRYLPQSRASRTPGRLLFSRAAAAFTRLYFRSHLSDYQCGLKAFRRRVLFDLVGEAGYDYGMNRGFTWDTEILLRAQRRGYRIAEVPVRWVESRRSSIKPLRDWRMIPYLLGLKSRL